MMSVLRLPSDAPFQLGDHLGSSAVMLRYSLPPVRRNVSKRPRPGTQNIFSFFATAIEHFPRRPNYRMVIRIDIDKIYIVIYRGCTTHFHFFYLLDVLRSPLEIRNGFVRRQQHASGARCQVVDRQCLC